MKYRPRDSSFAWACALPGYLLASNVVSWATLLANRGSAMVSGVAFTLALQAADTPLWAKVWSVLNVPADGSTAQMTMGTPMGAPLPTGWAGSVSWPQSL